MRPHTHEGGGAHSLASLDQICGWWRQQGAGTSLNKGKGWIKEEEEEECGSLSPNNGMGGWITGSHWDTGQKPIFNIATTHSD